MNFEVKIDCKGSAVGTLGWLNEVLSNSKLVIKNTKSGSVGLFMKTLKKDGVIDTNFICSVYNGNKYIYDTHEIKRYSNTDIKSIFVYNEEYQFGLFDHPLTPASYNKCSEFLDKCCETFTLWWESDGKEKEKVGEGIKIVIVVE